MCWVVISADVATWISNPIAERCPDAERCVDLFHIVMLATDELDEVRREEWNEARRQGNRQLVHNLADLARVAAEVNERPGKTLGWSRPVDLFTTALASA